MPSEAEIEAAALAIDAHWSDQDARRMDFYATEAAYQDHCRDTARAALSAASAVRSEGVGWETPEEWELEQDVFDAANHSDVPEWAQKTVAELWRQYCLLSQPEPKGDKT